MVDIIRALVPFILAGVIGWVVWQVGGDILERIMGSRMWGAIAIVAVVFITALAFTLVWQPSSVAKLTEFGFGIGRQQAEVDAKLYRDIRDPKWDPSTWPNPVSRAAAKSAETGYELTTAQSKTAITQAEAERLCYLPEGHGDRVMWDRAGVDPCTASTPAGIQAATKTLGKVDLSGLEHSLRQPVGSAPAGSSGWVQDMWNAPTLVVALGAFLVFMIGLGLSVRLMR